MSKAFQSYNTINLDSSTKALYKVNSSQGQVNSYLISQFVSVYNLCIHAIRFYVVDTRPMLGNK